MLEALSGRLATVALKGFVFFGSSVALSDKVIKLAESLLEGHGQVHDTEDVHSEESSAALDGAGGDVTKQHARAAVVVAAGGPTRVVGGSLKRLQLDSVTLAGEIIRGVTGQPAKECSRCGSRAALRQSFSILCNIVWHLEQLQGFVPLVRSLNAYFTVDGCTVCFTIRVNCADGMHPCLSDCRSICT